MKKVSAGIVSVAVIALLAGTAVAWDHMGYGYNRYGLGCGQANGYYNNPGDNLDAQNRFLNQTADLRKDLTAKRVQLDAVMSRSNPDSRVAGKLSKEVFELRNELNAKAEKAGVTGPLAGSGYGYGHNGRGMRASGGYCWR